MWLEQLAAFVKCIIKQLLDEVFVKMTPIQNNQGLGKGYHYQPRPSASVDNHTSTSIILDITKILSNSCF